MNITKNCVVSIDFQLTDEQGTLLDASREGEPLIYLHGATGIVPGLEKELEGRAVGEQFAVTITPEEGFGASNPDLIHTVALALFSDPGRLEPGVQIQGTDEESGEVTNFLVREVTDESVTLDSNHPLAGLTLRFEGVVRDVRAASEEEIRQGHPL